MKISINGSLFVDNSLNYDHIHQLVNDNSYNSIGDAVISKLSDAIHQSGWYHHTPQNFDLVHNFNDVQAFCGDNAVCYMDSLNWAIMNKSELTADIYKFITNQTSIMREGIQNNLIPHYHIDFYTFHLPKLIPNLLDCIDWHFILDCISWFF
jgi:hypothetical protein